MVAGKDGLTSCCKVLLCIASNRDTTPDLPHLLVVKYQAEKVYHTSQKNSFCRYVIEKIDKDRENFYVSSATEMGENRGERQVIPPRTGAKKVSSARFKERRF